MLSFLDVLHNFLRRVLRDPLVDLSIDVCVLLEPLTLSLEVDFREALDELDGLTLVATPLGNSLRIIVEYGLFVVVQHNGDAAVHSARNVTLDDF